MNELELFYSIRNGGDGSASVHFMESEALTNWDQDNMDEGWGESCNGVIKLRSESPVLCDEKIETKEQVFVELFTNNKEKCKPFSDVFFKSTPPIFRVEASKLERYYDVLHNEICVSRIFAYPESIPIVEKAKIIENTLNSITQ